MNARHLDGDEPTPGLGTWHTVTGPVEWGDPPRDTVRWPEPPPPDQAWLNVEFSRNRMHPFVAGLLFGAGLTVALCLAGLAVVALAAGLGVW